MPSGQNGVRTSEFELSFKSMPSVLKAKQRNLKKIQHSNAYPWLMSTANGRDILIFLKMGPHGANYSLCVPIFNIAQTIIVFFLSPIVCSTSYTFLLPIYQDKPVIQ
jgi:hypothetical protein